MPENVTRSNPWSRLPRRGIVFLAGLLLTVLGITVVLQQWDAVVTVFRAFIGPMLAVTGLVILFASSFK